jgi:predicted PhzF superfamily epimerase YddE/YHI9
VYLAQLGLLTPADGRAHFTGIQGHYLHRPGRVEVELEFSDARLDGVWIRGQAVSIFHTQMTL